MKTTVINFYGGPGIGKSTTAAGLFYHLKLQGVDCELVQEYVKEWAWTGQIPGPLDQYHFFGEQTRRESRLYNRVPIVVTDSPVLLSALYDRVYDSKLGLDKAVTKFLDKAAEHDVEHLHFVLTRTKAYNPNGRFQTESEAKAIDRVLTSLLRELGIPFQEIDLSPDLRVDWLMRELRSICINSQNVAESK